MGEVDPNGIDAHAPGAKLDAGKLRPHLVLGGFANALEQVIKVGTDGAAKYSDNGWKEVKGGESRYMDALGRHLLALQKGETHDPLSGSPHLAHVAWNALAVLELTSSKTVMQPGAIAARTYDGLVACLDCAWCCESPNPCLKCTAQCGVPTRSKWKPRL